MANSPTQRVPRTLSRPESSQNGGGMLFSGADFDAHPVYMSERAGMALISLVSRSATKSR
jgi:hypothetical protein